MNTEVFLQFSQRVSFKWTRSLQHIKLSILLFHIVHYSIMLFFISSFLAQHKPTSTISQNYTLEIVHFVARLKDAGPEPVIALLTDSADDVSEIAERLSERIDEITTYPMWLIGRKGICIIEHSIIYGVNVLVSLWQIVL